MKKRTKLCKMYVDFLDFKRSLTNLQLKNIGHHTSKCDYCFKEFFAALIVFRGKSWVKKRIKKLGG